MEVRELTFMKRKNLGNYEHEEVSMVAAIGEGEDLMEAVAKVKFACMQALDMVVKVEATPEVKEEVKDEKPVKKAKATRKTRKKKPVEPVAESNDEPKDEASPEVKEEVEAEVTVSLDELKKGLASVWKTKGKSVAVALLEKFGVKRSDELAEEKYGEVMKEIEKCLK